jgi:hypothetical protein
VDVLDPAVAASWLPEPGGLSVAGAEAVLTAAAAALPLAGAGITGHVPGTEPALLTRLVAALGL